MADPKKIAPGNIDGDFFVDTTCISCGNCRDLAPENFAKSGSYYVISKQPQTKLELKQVIDALICCPLGSVGTTHPELKHEIAQSISHFPELIEKDVYYLGFNSAQSFGGKSYFIKHRDGNWMVDSPKYSPRLVKFIEEHGGLENIFLTHRDDVAEAREYAQKFRSKRYIHQADLEAQKDAEIVFSGIEAFNPHWQFKIIPTPGHTMGHSMLLYDEKFLFSGDVFTSYTYTCDAIEAWPPFYCWQSWEEQTKSIARLLSFDFEYMLPSHGKRFQGNKAETKSALKKCLLNCQNEKEPEPITLARAIAFDEIALWARHSGQEDYATYATNKAKFIRHKLDPEGS
ncbi:MAG: MBL fold metallo-hydrolase [Candidatus Melainabacteria bacterium]|nr:MBL fold metallo-hydrolase [Candidatus Melainabacteria bacterium]